MALATNVDQGKTLTPMQLLALGGHPAFAPAPTFSGAGGDGATVPAAAPIDNARAAEPDGGDTQNVPDGAPRTPTGDPISDAPGAPGGTEAPIGAPPNPTDTNPLAGDPMVQAQNAEDQRLLRQGAAGSLASTKDLLLGFGSQELGKSTLDEMMKDPQIAAMFTPADEEAFLKTISADPSTSLSTLARIARSQKQAGENLDNNAQAGNLFYSGARAQGLGDQAYSNEAQSADARAKVQGALQNISQAYVAAQNAARAGDLSAFQAAYDRALQEAQTYGTGDDGSTPAPTGGAASTATSPSSATPKSAAAAMPKVAKAPTAKVQAAAVRALALRSAGMNAAHGIGAAKPKKKAAAQPYAGKH